MEMKETCIKEQMCLSIVGVPTKYAKSCCHKTTWAIILMAPSLRSAYIKFYIIARRLDYCTQEVVPSQRAAW